MCRIPLIILYIISLAMFLLDLRLGKSRDCNIEVTLEYVEKLFRWGHVFEQIQAFGYSGRLVWGPQTKEAYLRIARTSDL